MLIFNYGLTVIIWHKISKDLKNGQNKCPKMKPEKNFPRKISFIYTTYEGNFWSDLFQNFMIFPSLCSVSDFKYLNFRFVIIKKLKSKYSI